MADTIRIKQKGHPIYLTGIDPPTWGARADAKTFASHDQMHAAFVNLPNQPQLETETTSG
jgi:hypothetical protein